MGLKRTLIGSLLFQQCRVIIFWLNVFAPALIYLLSRKSITFFFFLSWETIWLETELQLKTRQRRPPANWKTREYKLSNPTMFSLLIDQLLLYIYTNYKSWRFPSLPCRRNVLCTFSALGYDLSSPISSPSLSVPGSLLPFVAAFMSTLRNDDWWSIIRLYLKND